MFDGFNIIFSLMPVFFCIVFAMVLGGFVFTIIKGIKTWKYNNAQPRLTVDAKVVSKRTNVISHMHNDTNGIAHHHTSTSYYVTFEVESGDRIEFHVDGSEYGRLVEGDTGRLLFQGTRYLSFDRN